MSEPLAPPPPPPGGGYGYGGPPAGGPPMRPGLPWEREKSVGSLVETVKQLVTRPVETMDSAREKGDYGSPLLFAVVFMVIGAFFSALWSLLGPGPDAMMSQLEGIEGIPPELLEAIGSGAAGPGSVVVSMVLAPLCSARTKNRSGATTTAKTSIASSHCRPTGWKAHVVMAGTTAQSSTSSRRSLLS